MSFDVLFNFVHVAAVVVGMFGTIVASIATMISIALVAFSFVSWCWQMVSNGG